MNYRHAYHAGNFADVHKHVALVAALLHLRKKQTPFAVIDTHAGRGFYDIASEAASRTGEAAQGIARLAGLAPQEPVLRTYLEIAGSFGAGCYPGSPLIAAKLLRQQDRLVAIEKHSEEFAALKTSLVPFVRARAVEGDGYERLASLLPPPERRGLVLIDPPYESPDECDALVAAFRNAIRRFATGIALIWYPLKAAARFEALAGEILAAGGTRLLSLTFDVGGALGPERLSASGLLMVNPPYGFDAQMRAACQDLLPQLRQGPQARAVVEWLGGPG
ncbi:MAG TPA: 23S rRNA (adenine(2030)-N(6))-methyltransferase RlmJ [Rhizomicrobium sp.]|jgi:23S rRNA (adenine2030-N6)-methyltransferase